MDYHITYREKDKGIQVIISYKTDDGWKQKSKQGFKTKKASKDWIDDTVKALKAKQKLSKEYDGITFEEYTELFLENAKRYKAPNTVRNYKYTISYFKKLNNKKLEDIKSIHVQNCFDDMADLGLETSTIKNYLNFAKAMFNMAISPYRIILENPVREIVIPENKRNRDRTALTEKEYRLLLSKVKLPKHKAIVLLAGSCGLRVSEILGLTWNCIDFKGKKILIEKQWKKDKSGVYGFGELKGTKSYRTIPMPNEVKDILLAIKNKYPINISNRVLPYSAGPVVSTFMCKEYKKLGFDISTHELRHTYATTLIANGLDFKTVAMLMGHDVEQTIKTYSHVTDEMMNKAEKLIHNIF